MAEFDEWRRTDAGSALTRPIASIAKGETSVKTVGLASWEITASQL